MTSAKKIEYIDWYEHVTSDGNSIPYLSSPVISLPDYNLGRFRVKMSVKAEGFAGNVQVLGSFRIFDETGDRLGGRTGVPVRYSRDLEMAAERWLGGGPWEAYD